jgi:hypothetical protein
MRIRRSISLDRSIYKRSIYGDMGKLDDLRAMREAQLGKSLRTPPEKKPAVKDAGKVGRGVDLPTQLATAPAPCPVCEARRKAKAAAQARWRAKQ